MMSYEKYGVSKVSLVAHMLVLSVKSMYMLNAFLNFGDLDDTFKQL